MWGEWCECLKKSIFLISSLFLPLIILSLCLGENATIVANKQPIGVSIGLEYSKKLRSSHLSIITHHVMVKKDPNTCFIFLFLFLAQRKRKMEIETMTSQSIDITCPNKESFIYLFIFRTQIWRFSSLDIKLYFLAQLSFFTSKFNVIMLRVLYLSWYLRVFLMEMFRV